MKGSVAAWVFAAVVSATGLPAAAQSQDGQVWIQIEARNNRAAAEERLLEWAASLPQVTGFALASGWYAVALGPFSAEEAARRLAELRQAGAIPRDSFIADGRVYRGRFGDEAAPTPAAVAEPAPQAEPAPRDTIPPGESLAEARRAEAALGREDRLDIQRALQWFGVYSSAIDGAFGAGTRAAVSAWQTAKGAEPTGVLTTAQRAALVGDWRAEVAAIGLEVLRDEEAGIEIALPLGLVGFDRYTPPFAQYGARNDSGMQVWLISQPGNQDTLYGLYDFVQSLARMPTDGPRNRRPRGFEIAGRNAETEAYAWADLNQGLIRGYLVIASTADTARTARVLQAMKASFRPFGERALDPGLVPLDEATKAGLLAGVEVRKPVRSASGFFVDAQGSVLTAAATIEGCDRVTLDSGLDARVVATDAALGVALLRPATPLAPQRHAGLAAALPAPGSEIAVAGFSFGAELPLPSVTFGRYEAATALDGSDSRARMTLGALPGDAGAPVIGGDGLVVGVLQPRSEDPARFLPPEVAFMAPAPAIAAWLAGQGHALPVMAPVAGRMAPEDLAAIGTAMAAQVACWQ